ncbi:hypothetical protein ACFL1G_05630 [Planctomycetota bacterium]
MWEMKCPKCGRRIIRWWPDDLFSPRSDRKDCIVCGSKFELKNPYACYLPNGLLFGVLTFGLGIYGVGYPGLRYIGTAILCWLINPFLVRFLGRWDLVKYADARASKARMWGLISIGAWWIFGTAVVVTILSFSLQFSRLIAELDYLNYFTVTDEEEPISSFSNWIWTYFLSGFIISIIAYVVCKIAAYEKMRLIDEFSDKGREGAIEK